MGELLRRGRRLCSTWLPGIVLGQTLSLLATGTSWTSATLVQQGVALPAAQALFTYLLLAIIFGSIFCSKGKFADIPWKFYVALAVVDMEANFVVVTAFQYTSITSIMLLDCWAIPCSVLATWLLFGTQYRKKHFVGIFICTLGMVLLVCSDVHAADRVQGSKALLGDMIILFGATLYAVSNVGEEYILKSKSRSRTEVLAFVGLFGSIVSFIQLLSLERVELASITWESTALVPFVAYGMFSFLFYVIAPFLFQIGGSAMFNLSLLTSDVWGVAIRSLVFHQSVDWLYFVAFGSFAIGLVIYSSSPLAYDGLDGSAKYRVLPLPAGSSSAIDDSQGDFGGSPFKGLCLDEDLVVDPRGAPWTGVFVGEVAVREEQQAISDRRFEVAIEQEAGLVTEETALVAGSTSR